MRVSVCAPLLPAECLHVMAKCVRVSSLPCSDHPRSQYHHSTQVTPCTLVMQAESDTHTHTHTHAHTHAYHATGITMID